MVALFRPDCHHQCCALSMKQGLGSDVGNDQTLGGLVSVITPDLQMANGFEELMMVQVQIQVQHPGALTAE